MLLLVQLVWGCRPRPPWETCPTGSAINKIVFFFIYLINLSFEHGINKLVCTVVDIRRGATYLLSHCDIFFRKGIQIYCFHFLCKKNVLQLIGRIVLYLQFNVNYMIFFLNIFKYYFYLINVINTSVFYVLYGSCILNKNSNHFF